MTGWLGFRSGPLHKGPLPNGPLRLAFALLMVTAIPWMRPATAHGALQATQADAQRTVWDGVYTEAQAER